MKQSDKPLAERRADEAANPRNRHLRRRVKPYSLQLRHSERDLQETPWLRSHYWNARQWWTFGRYETLKIAQQAAKAKARDGWWKWEIRIMLDGEVVE